jgi:hypothetical protein
MRLLLAKPVPALYDCVTSGITGSTVFTIETRTRASRAFDSSAEDIRPSRAGLPPTYRMRGFALRGPAGIALACDARAADRRGNARCAADRRRAGARPVHRVSEAARRAAAAARAGTRRRTARHLGQRRLAAAIAVGLRDVPCLVHDVQPRRWRRPRCSRRRVFMEAVPRQRCRHAGRGSRSPFRRRHNDENTPISERGNVEMHKGTPTTNDRRPT